MILATSAFLVAALANTTPAKALTGNEELCGNINYREDCNGPCTVVEDDTWWGIFYDWSCIPSETGTDAPEEAKEEEEEEEAEDHEQVCNRHSDNQEACEREDKAHNCVYTHGWIYSECSTDRTDAPEDEEVEEEEAGEYGDVCNKHWDNKDNCHDKNCVFIRSESWLYYDECRTDGCDLYALDEHNCSTSKAAKFGCAYTQESTFYTSSCEDAPAPVCEKQEDEFAHRSTDECSCGDIEAPKGSLACFAELGVVVEKCEDYMDVHDDACDKSKVCKLADQGLFASWVFVRECIPKGPEEIVEVTTDITVDVNGVEVDVDTDVDVDVEPDVKKGPSSRSSTKKPSNNGKNGKGERKKCGAYPCFVLEYKFYFVSGFGAMATLLVMFIVMKCCSRRRAKE